MNFATSDIHGYSPVLFIELLEKAGFGPSDRLYVIGDVIDRNGDGGVAVLRWMMKQPNVTLIVRSGPGKLQRKRPEPAAAARPAAMASERRYGYNPEPGNAESIGTGRV